MSASIHASFNASRPCPAFGALSQPTGSPLQGLAATARRIHVESGAEIVAQGGQAAYCFIVLSGCVRTVALMEDGRRQVGAFYLPGDIFGWDFLGEYDMSAEAVIPSVLGRISLRNVEQMADQDPALARAFRRLAVEQLRQAREHMVMLSRMTALERIASFLAEMASRSGRAGQAVSLPMGRADIADHLGLTVETVCRSLGQLRRAGTIGLERHGFRILDRVALASAREASVH